MHNTYAKRSQIDGRYVKYLRKIVQSIHVTGKMYECESRSGSTHESSALTHAQNRTSQTLSSSYRVPHITLCMKITTNLPNAHLELDKQLKKFYQRRSQRERYEFRGIVSQRKCVISTFSHSFVDEIENEMSVIYSFASKYLSFYL